jgi:hypothetical protein
MPAKCVYCGAELPEQADVKITCPVCDQEQPDQTADANQSGLRQPPEPEPGGPEFSAPPEAEPAPDDSHSAPPPPPPQSGPDAPAGPTEHTPAWEQEGGFWLAKLWKTIWQVLLHPVLTFSASGRLHQQRFPLGFGMIMGVCSMVIDAVMNPYLPEFMQNRIPAFYIIILSPLVTIVTLYVVSGIMHLFLIMVGAARGGYVATFRVNAYSTSFAVFDIIPVIGKFIGMVWGLVVLIGGLSAAHGTTYGRVIGAMLLGFASFLMLLLFIILIDLRLGYN